MHLSHSALQQILTCPATYFLSKVEGILPKKPSKALQIGSAFHWGCEHNTDDLTEYLKELDQYTATDSATQKDITLAEGMVYAYLQKKQAIFQKILTDYNGYGVLQLLDEQHELDLVAPLKSYKYDVPHEFHGIIDLLLLTDKGWIVLDYKTSTQTPDFDKYLDQVLRYKYLVNTLLPEFPVYKIGIINVKKVSLRQKENENSENYLMRLKREYTINDDNLVTYHEFIPDDFSDQKSELYLKNFSRMCDFAQTIDENKLWFINYGNATSVYGKSEYWDIFYKTQNCFYMYKIYDPMFNPDFNEVTDYRDCVALDLEVLEHDNVLNHYSKFAEIRSAVDDIPKEDFFKVLKENYLTDDTLLERYWNEYERLKDVS